MKDFEKDLIYGETVYVRVDAFNENGITEGNCVSVLETVVTTLFLRTLYKHRRKET